MHEWYICKYCGENERRKCHQCMTETREERHDRQMAEARARREHKRRMWQKCW